MDTASVENLGSCSVARRVQKWENNMVESKDVLLGEFLVDKMAVTVV